MLMSHPPVPAVAVHPDKVSTAEPVHCFSLRAEAEPGLLPRVIEIFAKNGMVPSRWHSDMLGPQNEELTIDIQVAGLTRSRAEYLARCMNQIYGVHTVLISDKY